MTDRALRVNAAWIILVVTFGAIGWLGVDSYLAHPDLLTVCALILLAVCGGAALRLCYRKTVS